MKTFLKTGIVLLTLLALGSCYLALDNGSGEVGITLPNPRSISGSAPADIARIYVLNGPNLVPVGDGTDYAEFDLAPSDSETLTEATVGPVPSGGGYQVVLVFGNEVTVTTDEDIAGVGGTGFVPVQYAVSGLFSVNAGQATVTDVTLSPTPFATIDGADTLGENIFGIVFSTGDLYMATGSGIIADVNTLPDLYDVVEDAVEPINFDTTISLSPGEVATGISYGAVFGSEAALVNTNFGVVPVVNGTPNPDFDSNIPATVGTVLDSGAIRISGTAYGYLQYAGGITGFRQLTAADPGVGDWMEPADLSDLVVGQAVYDMAVAQYDNGVATVSGGFFATKLGAFLLPQSILVDPLIDTTEEVLEEAIFFSAEIGGNYAAITQIALAGDSTAPTAPIYLGTKRGAINTTISSISDGAVITGTPIAGTQNQEVIDIAMGGTYVVILTDHFLTYSNDSGVTWTSVPVYAGASGPVRDILLDSTGGVVLLAGETGLSGISIQ